MRPTGGNYVFWVDGLALIERQVLNFACVGIWKVTATPMLRSPTHCLMVSGVTGFSASTMGNYPYKDGLSVFTGNDDQKSFSDRVVDVKFGWRDGYAGFQGRIDDLRPTRL